MAPQDPKELESLVYQLLNTIPMERRRPWCCHEYAPVIAKLINRNTRLQAEVKDGYACYATRELLLRHAQPNNLEGNFFARMVAGQKPGVSWLGVRHSWCQLDNGLIVDFLPSVQVPCQQMQFWIMNLLMVHDRDEARSKGVHYIECGKRSFIDDVEYVTCDSARFWIWIFPHRLGGYQVQVKEYESVFAAH